VQDGLGVLLISYAHTPPSLPSALDALLWFAHEFPEAVRARVGCSQASLAMRSSL